MSLVFGNGVLGPGGGTLSLGPVPEEVWYLEPWPRRMRAVLGGEVVLDSRRGQALYRRGQPFPQYWFPLVDLRAEVLVEAEPDGAGARRWSVVVDGRSAPESVRELVTDASGPPLTDHVTVEFGAMDRWFEEDDPVYAHPRDPYHRVDVRSGSQHVVVRHHDVLVAESRRPKLLFETGLAVRYYLPFEDVTIGLLERSDTVSECPYKGDGQHWHVVAGGDRIVDAAWSLPHPLPEGVAAHEHVSFYEHRLNVEVDGVRLR